MLLSSHAQTRSIRRARTYAVLVALCIGAPAVALGVPERVRIPHVREHGAGNPPDSALFSHWAHDTFTCVSCHPSTFPQRKLGFTHSDMEAGRFCENCHDNRHAFAPKDKKIKCETCHVPTKKHEINEDDLWN